MEHVRVKTRLKVGDLVMIIAGGNKTKKPIKGQVAKIKAFYGKNNDRVVLEGLNLVTKHQKQTAPGAASGKIKREAAMHISNIMFYAEKIKKPVRLTVRILDDGKKVRGYIDGQNKEFVQI